ncbi:hypothetical protein D3C85_399950 [compost metagenome]
MDGAGRHGEFRRQGCRHAAWLQHQSVRRHFGRADGRRAPDLAQRRGRQAARGGQRARRLAVSGRLQGLRGGTRALGQGCQRLLRQSPDRRATASGKRLHGGARRGQAGGRHGVGRAGRRHRRRRFPGRAPGTGAASAARRLPAVAVRGRAAGTIDRWPVSAHVRQAHGRAAACLVGRHGRGAPDACAGRHRRWPRRDRHAGR